jgi:uncharacterized protein (TIGR03435 family)
MKRAALLCIFPMAMAALAQPLQFEVASVKPSASTAWGSMRGGPGTEEPGQLTMTNVSLFQVIVRAYDVKAFQVKGPDWLSSKKYDIIAKVPANATKQECNRMLQTLLADRYHLSLHREAKDLAGYELVVAKGGSKLEASSDRATPAAGSMPPPATDSNGFPLLAQPGIAMMEGVRGKAVVSFLTARAQPVSSLVDLLGKEFRLPIVDRTGLTGTFDFHLEYAPERPGALPVEPSSDLADAPNLITAVQQQLGLRLKPAEIAVDMLIVDRADQVPTEN